MTARGIAKEHQPNNKQAKEPQRGFGCNHYQNKLIDESHFSGVGYQGDGNRRMGAKAAGPIDEEGFTNKIVAGDGAGTIGFIIVTQSGCAPEARVVRERTVVTHDKKLIVLEDNGIAFGAEALNSVDTVHATGGISIVSIAVKDYVVEVEGATGGEQINGGQNESVGLITPGGGFGGAELDKFVITKAKPPGMVHQGK